MQKIFIILGVSISLVPPRDSKKEEVLHRHLSLKLVLAYM